MDVPPIIGAGLKGRPDVEKMTPLGGRLRAQDEAVQAEEELRVAARTIPASCLRVVSSPLVRSREGCRQHKTDCPGVQRDGSCLAELVIAANEAGVEWAFEIDPRDNFWDYVGEPVPGYEPRSGPPMEDGPVEVTEFDFECPHCGAVARHPVGFYWCPRCNLNAKDRIPDDPEVRARVAELRAAPPELAADIDEVDEVTFPVRVIRADGNLPPGGSPVVGVAESQEQLNEIIEWCGRSGIAQVELEMAEPL